MGGFFERAMAVAGAPFQRMSLRPLKRWFADLGATHPLVRFMIVHWGLGIAAGLFCAGSLLWINPLGLRDLLFRSPDWPLFLILLFMGFATTFGGLVCAAAVMFPENRTQDGDHGTRVKASSGPAEAAVVVAKAR